MENINEFWSGLVFILTILGKLMIVTGIILFGVVLINFILKRVNAPWSQKYVKKINKIITSADGLKSIIRSFEKLIDVLFNAFSAFINLFALFIEAVFISINKFLLSPLEIFISYINIFSNKMEKFNSDLNANNERNDDQITKENRVENDNSQSDQLIDEMLKNKTQPKTDNLMDDLLINKKSGDD